MTQRDRILTALQTAGARGITQVDFLRFPTVDGGPPITRVAARVEELRKQGHDISSSGTRDRCAIYRLRVVASDEPVRDQPRLGGPASAVGEPPDTGSSEAITLFDPAAVNTPLGAYDEYDAAA